MEIKTIDVKKNIYEENQQIAQTIKQTLNNKGVYCINVMGAPGVGKTSALQQIIKRITHKKSYVIEGDIESDIDTLILKDMGVEAIQINTFGACHLDSPMIEKAISEINFCDEGILFIENVGNLVCPAEFAIGENIKMLICSVTDGSDKPYKYPLAFEKADVILLNKVDLKPYVNFNDSFFYDGIRALNPGVSVFEVSASAGEGFERLVDWICNISKV